MEKNGNDEIKKLRETRGQETPPRSPSQSPATKPRGIARAANHQALSDKGREEEGTQETQGTQPVTESGSHHCFVHPPP